MMRVAVENDGPANVEAPALTASNAGKMAKCRAELAQWREMAATALSCVREAGDYRSRCALASYTLRNLLRRFGVPLRLDKEVTARLRGISVSFLPLQGELHLFKEIFVDQAYEKHPAFRLCPGWCVFDVGANIGLFTLKAAACHQAGQAFAFEPNPQTFARLQANVRQNDLNNVMAIPKAVGRAAGWAAFDPGAASTLGRLAAAQPHDTAAGLGVEVVTLSGVLQQEQVFTVHLLKLDVEGAEAEVLRGGEPVLERIERIVMEYHSADLLAECEGILRRHRFRRVLLAPPAYAYFLRASVAV
jgi:FkbM family methyltransferase